MKLTAFLLLIGCIHVSAHGLAQDRITFSGKEVPLEKVFSVIKKQTSYLFLYNDVYLENAKKVTINVKNASVEEVLNACFKDQPFDYTIKGKTIFIINRQAEEKKEVSVIIEAPPVDEIKGRITNAAGEPLSGANIVVKRTGKGTQANANGEFTLKNVGPDEMITISYTGYAPQTVKIGGSKNLLLVMKLADNELDEMVVQGYGTTTRRLATGNIAKVTAAEIERQPVMNPLLALQGRVPGLDVTQTNGFASAPIKVELRGRNSINTSFTSDPLYIIDGVPLTVLEISGISTLYASGSPGFIQNGLSPTSPAGGQSPFFSINPADIESMEVLKDADATAIYGSRAANGVILITTKRGKAGKTKLNLHIQKGITKQARYWSMLNTQQYLQMRWEALKNDGITPNITNGDYDLLQWDTTTYTDWQRTLYGGTGKIIDIQTELSGGNANTSFRLGSGYNHVTNILTVSGADQRGSLSFNLTHSALNQRFSLAFTSVYSFAQSNMINLPNAITLPPNAPPIYDSLGNLNYSGWGGQNTVSRDAYPFASLRQPYISKTNFLNSNLALNYQPIKEMSLRINFGYSNAQANQERFILIASFDPLINPTGISNFGFNSNKNWIVEPQVTFEQFVDKGKLSVLLGSSIQETNTFGTYISGSGYTSDNLIKSIANAPVKGASDNQGTYRYAAIFGRITYNLVNKYIFNLNARRDGSSRFGPGKQFGNFVSVSAAWLFSEEKLFKNYISFLSFGKFRGSYGTTGSDAVGEYKYLTQWSSNNTQPYNGVSVLAPTLHANPNFQWQVNKKLEAAIDLFFLKDRINLNISYYQNRCGNQLLNIPLPTLTGFSTVVANWPALVQNSGWEFSLGAKVINFNNFHWSMTFNTAINRNKVLAFPNISQTTYKSSVFIGRSLNSLYLLHYAGVDPLTGEYTFVDKNHDGRIARNVPESDDTYNYDMSPKFFGGLGMDFSYKNIKLNLFFVIKKQIGKNALLQYQVSPGAIGNQPLEILEGHWENTKDIASVGRFTTKGLNSAANFRSSDGVYTDASYIRLSGLSLSYTVPSKFIKKAGAQGCSIYVHSNNIFTITKYKGIDPETQLFGTLPPAKSLVAGMNFNF